LANTWRKIKSWGRVNRSEKMGFGVDTASPRGSENGVLACSFAMCLPGFRDPDSSPELFMDACDNLLIMRYAGRL